MVYPQDYGQHMVMITGGRLFAIGFLDVAKVNRVCFTHRQYHNKDKIISMKNVLSLLGEWNAPSWC
jgi:hypothetical protein